MFKVKKISLQATLQFVLLVALTCTSSISLSAKRVIESGDDSPGFSYATDSDTSEPIIRYQLRIDMLANIQDRQTISVYGDGRVVVHYPAYMKDAGDYQMQLSEDELNQLIRELSDGGMMDFDHKEAKSRVEAARKLMRDKGQLYEVSDDVETVVEISLDEYQKNTNSKKVKGFNKQFRWKNIRHDAARYKNDSAINRAHDAVKRIQGFKKDSRLVRVGQQ
jgi:hypothetical protein